MGCGAAAGYGYAGLGAAEGGYGAFQFGFGVAVGDALLGAGDGFLGAGFVDFVHILGGVGQDDDGVAEDFHIAAGEGEVGFGAGGAHGQFAGLEDGHQGGVVGQDAELAGDARGYQGVDFAGENFALGGDDLQLHGHRQGLLISVGRAGGGRADRVGPGSRTATGGLGAGTADIWGCRAWPV